MLTRTHLRTWLWSGLIVAAGFLIDVRGSSGIAVVLCYEAAIVVALRLPRRRDVLAIASACSALTLLVGLLRVEIPLAGWTARGLVLFALWVVALAAPLAAPEEPGIARAGIGARFASLVGVVIVLTVVVIGGGIYVQFLGLVRGDGPGSGVPDARLAQIAERSVYLAGAVLLAAMVAGWGVAQSVTAPLTRMTAEVRRFSERGGRRPDLPVGGRDETGQLAAAFAHLIELTERRRERLEHATEELERRNHDLETLLYVASHDLREPLRSIEGFSRLVRDRHAEALPEQGRDYLERVVRGAQRLDRLLRDLLEVSRAQRLVAPSERVSTGEVVADALARLESQIGERGARVCVAGDLPTLFVDRLWITQAIYNLVANALKFVSPGATPEVEIAGYEASDGARGVVVRDRGPGIDPANAERVFELFQRAVGREVEGTGAGLAIVRRVVDRHGGRVWVQPRPGGGSEFVLVIPEGKTT